MHCSNNYIAVIIIMTCTLYTLCIQLYNLYKTMYKNIVRIYSEQRYPTDSEFLQLSEHVLVKFIIKFGIFESVFTLNVELFCRQIILYLFQ